MRLLHFLLRCFPVNRTETKGNRADRCYSYTKALDNRKHPIHGLWRRNGQFYARIVIENAEGQKSTPLRAPSLATFPSIKRRWWTLLSTY